MRTETSKKVWIMNHYAGSMFFEKGGRHYSFAKYMRIQGFEPVIFCSNAKHGDKEYFQNFSGAWQEYMAEEIKVPFVFVRSRLYLGNGKQRVLNMMDFYRNVKLAAREYSQKNGKPDIIYASSVHPLSLVAGIELAKYFGVKCVCEVRDLWPESFVAFGIVSAANPVLKLLYRGERWIYKKADALIFSMEGGRDYIIEKGWDKAHGGPVDLSKVWHINNGVDLKNFDFNCEHSTLADDDLEREDTFKVVYCGSIRKANNLGLLLDVAKRLNDDSVQFLIWGSGDESEALEHRITEEDIKNVHLKGRVPKQYIPYINSKANLTVLNYEVNDIWRYGGSQNKLFEYFASGTPVMTNIRMGYDLIDRYDCGFHVDYSDIDSVASLLSRLKSMPQEEYSRYCANARKAAEEYDFKRLADKLCRVFEKCMK